MVVIVVAPSLAAPPAANRATLPSFNLGGFRREMLQRNGQNS